MAIGRDDHRPFEGVSDVPELGRLARYRPIPTPAAAEALRQQDHQGPEGRDVVTEQLGGHGEFAPVAAKDLADVPRVYVFVHGWVPGSRATTDLLYAQRGDIARAWDTQVTNVVGETMVESYTPLLDALSHRDPEAAVLWFSWVDQSGTDIGLFSARQSLHNTEINGRRLAVALTEAFGKGRPQVHLIGHSHGCVVSAHAALALPRPPEHLTLLDCPDGWFSRAGGAAGLLDDLLPRLLPGRGPGRTFVDSYISMFGRPYHDKPGLSDVVDVWLRPSISINEDASAVSQAHQYPVRWYAETVLDDEAGAGFVWSPLHGANTTELGASYLRAGKSLTVEVSRRTEPENAPENPEYSQELVGASAVLSRGEPDVLFSLVAGPDATFLEFDYEVRKPGRSTRLDAAVDRRLCFTATARTRVPARGRYVRLAAETELPGIVQFRLVDPGLFTTVTIDRVRILRKPRRARNYNDLGASASFAVLGAAAGAAAALTVVGIVSLVRRALR